MEAKKSDTEASDFTREEVERRALETARRLLATPKRKGACAKPRAPEPSGPAPATTTKNGGKART